MRRRRLSVGGGGARNPRSLANLKRGDNAPPSGNRLAVSHGAYAAIAAERLDAKGREVFDALAADAPLRDPSGGLPAADAVMVSLLADALCRLEDVRSYLRDRGLVDGDGALRPAVDLERRLRMEAADYLDAMAMSPRSRAKMGVDTVRGLSLVEELAAGREALERRNQADVEATVEEAGS